MDARSAADRVALLLGLGASTDIYSYNPTAVVANGNDDGTVRRVLLSTLQVGALVHQLAMLKNPEQSTPQSLHSVDVVAPPSPHAQGSAPSPMPTSPSSPAVPPNGPAAPPSSPVVPCTTSGGATFTHVAASLGEGGLPELIESRSTLLQGVGGLGFDGELAAQSAIRHSYQLLQESEGEVEQGQLSALGLLQLQRAATASSVVVNGHVVDQLRALARGIVSLASFESATSLQVLRELRAIASETLLLPPLH
eukprot:595590-Prymnesium_polylepis.1